MPKENLIEKIAMNIVFQLDDDSGASVEFRQANNDKRINFVMGLLSEAKSLGRSEALKEVREKIENMAIETVGNSAKTVEQILNLLTK